MAAPMAAGALVEDQPAAGEDPLHGSAINMAAPMAGEFVEDKFAAGGFESPPAALIDALYDQVRARVVLRDLKPSNAMIMLTYAMATVERQRSLSGLEKKEFATQIVRRLVGEIPGDAADKLALQAAVDLLFPPLIDTLVAAGRGLLDVNSDGVISHDELSGCWRRLFCCGRGRE